MADLLENHGEYLERLEAAARNRWGDDWSIEVLFHGDGRRKAFAVCSYGLAEDYDEKVVVRERLWIDDENDKFQVQRVHVRDAEVLDSETILSGELHGDICGEKERSGG